MAVSSRIRNGLQHRHARRWIVLLGCCLTLPSLFVGFATDDHNLRAVFQGYPGMPEVEQAPWDAFRFHFSEDPAVRQERMDRGLLPWWAGEETHTAFLRPLSSLSHWLDWQLFGEHAWPMHAHNILLFGVLLALVGSLYRRLVPPAPVAPVAALALLLYAVDDARGLPVGWLSARNSLLTALFGVAVLLLHDEFRRGGRRWAYPVAMAALGVGLACAEAAVSIGGYLFAYALFVDPARFRRGFVALLPYGVVVIVWRVIYQNLGYGTFASGGYVNPTDEPLLFLYRIGERLPVLFFGAFGLPDCTFYNFLPGMWSRVYWVVAFVFVVLVLWALVPLLRQDRRARFWLLGMTLAALPACLTAPQDRMLMFPALGGMALIALYLQHALPRLFGEAGRVAQPSPRREDDRVPQPSPQHEDSRVAQASRLCRPDQNEPAATHLSATLDSQPEKNNAGIQSLPVSRPRRALAWFWTGAHLVLAPLLLLIGSYAIALVEGAAREANATLPNDPAIVDETVILVHTMSDLMGPGIPIFRASLRQPVPAHTYMLSAGNQAAEVTRTDEHTLIIRPDGGYLLPTWAELFRSITVEPFAPGDTQTLDGVDITVLECTPDGRPTAVAFRFEAPLESPEYHWYYWTGRGYAEFALPEVGGAVEIPKPAI